MKKGILIGLIVVCISILGANVSHAVVLDFSDLDIPGDNFTYMYSYSNSGFSLTSDYNEAGAFLSPQQSMPWYFGSANLFNNYGYAWTTLSSSGGLFTINSMDLHGLFCTINIITFYAYNSDDAQVGYQSSTLPDNSNWYTTYFDSSFENIYSLKWQQVAPYHSFDNINVSSAVPEPASMLLFGLGGIATALIKRRRKT